MPRSPIAYLPGAGGRSSFWKPVADRLWRTGAPMLFGYPGFGEVPADPDVRSLDDYFDALVKVLPDRVHLVAQSMGCVLALRMAIEHPGRVAKLVLFAPTGGVDVRALGGAEWRAELRAEKPHLPAWFLEDASDFTEKLRDVRAPTLVLVGDADPLSPVRVGEFLCDRTPSAELRVLPGGTHDMPEEAPDRVATEIARFLA